MTDKTEITPAPSEPVLSIGTCGGQLAQARATALGDQIRRITGGRIELVTIQAEPTADSSRQVRPEATGAHSHSPRACVAAIREALRNNEFTLAVHALVDLPSEPARAIRLGAIVQRLDARDAVCARDGLTLAELPPGARVGAESARRIAQLEAIRNDLKVIDAEHDAGVLLEMVATGSLDAAVVSVAELSRLELLDQVACEILELPDWPTGAGQGALAIEVREHDFVQVSLIRALLARLDHRPTRATATAERHVKERLEEHTDAAFGVYAILDGSLLLLSATVYDGAGSKQITSSHGVVLDGMSPAATKVAIEALGTSVANDLIRNGAAEFTSTGVIHEFG
ncbi:hydroxymethylbilane synthase [Homoserinimonas sp. OAct 916]|uniref:hydroxymethylbilane synthase n=1 Tax=Homoserinimonas sp. OAct 916 TaxID=2211450 RepID=UPI0013002B49|nr:hydroxymethylbilane synthase [Homoserinimonas sp. OAct 916]